MRPLPQGDAKKFWAVVWGVKLQDEATREVVVGRAYTWQAPYVYYALPPRTIPLHGVSPKRVEEEELMKLFPAVLDGMLAAPSNHLTVAQLARLIDEQPKSISDGLTRLKQKRDDIASSPERMRAFLTASHKAECNYWARNRPEDVDAIMDEERDVGAFLQRTRCYWINVLFEALHASGLLALFWLPLLSVRLRRFLPICWGLIPLYVMIPFYLGYCDIALTSLGPVGGAIYPWTLQLAGRPFAPLTPFWDVALLHTLPRPLSSLTQYPIGVVAISGGAGSGPTPIVIFGLGIAAAAWLVPRLLRLVPRCASRRNPTSLF
jgi:hypothetical protein